MDKHVLQKKGFALAARAGGFSARLRTSETVRRVYAEVQQFVLAFLLARGTMFGRRNTRKFSRSTPRRSA